MPHVQIISLTLLYESNAYHAITSHRLRTIPIITELFDMDLGDFLCNFFSCVTFLLDQLVGFDTF